MWGGVGGPLHEKDVGFVLNATATVTKHWGLLLMIILGKLQEP